MPPKTQEGELSEKEKAVLANAWKCFDAEPKIDYKKLASIGGYTNINSVRNLVHGAKKKLKTMGESDANGNGEGSAASSPKATTTKKSAAATPKGKKRTGEEVNGNKDARTPKKLKKTPAKSATKTATKGKAVKDEDEVELEVEDEDELEVEEPEEEVMAEDSDGEI
ncbi:hypothetical protein CIB48_g5174 [Xylaria polymorpha]|nr:hypothetical protein CIB48_g5174 [Xylaria polymorpha]